ncbi:MAG: hypothetical protein D3924_19555 [Candidatus Electrothrix sp. AR4]|nr:hypothetical protein [Candidatus Electrothrix sp. AR4]
MNRIATDYNNNTLPKEKTERFEYLLFVFNQISNEFDFLDKNNDKSKISLSEYTSLLSFTDDTQLVESIKEIQALPEFIITILMYSLKIEKNLIKNESALDIKNEIYKINKNIAYIKTAIDKEMVIFIDISNKNIDSNLEILTHVEILQKRSDAQWRKIKQDIQKQNTKRIKELFRKTN